MDKFPVFVDVGRNTRLCDMDRQWSLCFGNEEALWKYVHWTITINLGLTLQAIQMTWSQEFCLENVEQPFYCPDPRFVSCYFPSSQMLIQLCSCKLPSHLLNLGTLFFFLALLLPSSWAVCLLSGAFAFLLISLFPIAGRAQYFLQPDFQRVRAGAGDHPQSHHCHRPGTLLWQPQAACWSAEHRRAGPEQPRPQVRGHALAHLSICQKSARWH